MNTQSEALTHQFNSHARFDFFISGVEKALMRLCPERDVHLARILGWIMEIVWCWQTALFSVMAHMLLAPAGEIRPELILAGMLVATLVLLIDNYMIMRPSWFLHGLEELKRGGLIVPGNPWMRVKAFIFLAVRLALSFVFALLTAIMLGVLIFAKDIAGEIDRAYLQRNSELFNAAAARVDEDMRKNAEARAQVANTIALAEEEQARLREAAVNPGPENAELKPLLDRVARLEQVRIGAEQALVRARNFTNNEGVGLPGEPGNSREAGQGPKWKAGVERVAIAEWHLEQATKAFAAAQERLRQVQESIAIETRARLKTIEDRLAEVERSNQSEKTRLAGLEEAYRQLTENRERIIWESVRRDPSFVPKDEGFLARVRVLQKLSDDSTVFTVVLLFELAFFVIELAAVLCKITAFVPTTYSVLLAKADFLRAVTAAQDVADEVAATRSPRHPPTPPAPPEFPSPPSGGSPSAPPENPSGTGPSTSTPPRRRGRPPGPTWRPNVWKPGGEGSPA
jgi:Domain of unknown function (DUF4407)